MSEPTIAPQLLAVDYTFLTALVSGYIGAICVYPIDLIKTRMQNQGTIKVYRNGLDCARQILINEGPRQMFRGSITQLIGVGPEKAIKIWMNKLVLQQLPDNLNSKIIAGMNAKPLHGE